MAIDHSLARLAAASGEGIVRLYGWAPAAISFGRHQRARGAYDGLAIIAAGLGVVRRPTGGRAILHDRELTYAVALPMAAATGAREAYNAVTELLRSALRAMGVAASRADRRGRARSPGPAPCFAEPAAGELTWDDRKLAGSAQWTEGSALLQHGSILLDNDQQRLTSFASTTADDVPEPATLRQALGRAPSTAEFALAWDDALTLATGERPRPLDAAAPDAQPLPLLLRLYHDPDWTWRR